MKIYLAGPEVFLSNPLLIGADLKSLCTAHGAIGLFPMDNALPTTGTGSEAGSVAQARAIRSANMALIESCDAVVANMEAFRGPSMDVGTAYEMGVGAAWGKIVVGYGAGEKGYVRKVKEATEKNGGKLVRGKEDGILRDGDGWAVEEFGVGEKKCVGIAVGGGGLVDNLMVACGIEALCETVEEAIKVAVELGQSRRLSKVVEEANMQSL